MTLAKDISTGREGGEVDDPLLGGSVVSLQICRGHHVAEQAKIQAAAAVASAALIDEDAPGFDGRSGRSSAMDHASSFAITSSSDTEAQDEFLQACLHIVQVSII